MAVTDAQTNPYKEIWDTFGIVRGSKFPDEIVMLAGTVMRGGRARPTIEAKQRARSRAPISNR
jgi:hypothetical protein